MLIDFSVKNFRSIESLATLSMERITRLREKQHDNYNFFSTKEPKHELLKTAVVYGANASGKSNLLMAMRFAAWFVSNSVQSLKPKAEIPVEPFRFSEESPSLPSLFEFRFHLGDSDYRYGFEVSQKRVEAEWLYCGEEESEEMLFERAADEIGTSERFAAGNDLISKTRDNALFLSTCAQFNEPISSNILTEFFNRFNVISGIQDEAFFDFSVELLRHAEYKKSIVDLLNILGTNIVDIQVDEDEPPPHFIPDKGSPKAKVKQVTTVHKIGGRSYGLDLSLESEGTKKLFCMAGPFLDTLIRGAILVIDELDARLHPILVKQLVQMFHRENKNNAQLIFATHDTNLLSPELFRRDQVWFTEKNNNEATELYSLAEYKLDEGKKVRQDALYEKEYLRGRYGAIPFLGNFDFMEAN